MDATMKSMSPKFKKGWALLRVSTKDQAEVQHGSLEQQRHMMERWQEEQIEKTGFHYQVTRIVEEDKSGKKASFSKRTEFQELQHAIENKLIDFVVFEKVDRMGRWQVANLQLIEAAYERGVEVHFIDDGKFNYRDRGKRLSFNVKNIFAEDYSLELEEKITKKQREAMVNNGKDTSTRPLLGLDPHPTRVGFYVLNKTEQETVNDIFSKFVELQELYATVQYCNEKGYRTKVYQIKEKIDRHGNRVPVRAIGGELFVSDTLKAMLVNAKLRGFGFFHDTWNQFPKLQDAAGKVRWEYGHFRESGPVVAPELFEKAQAILEKNRHKASKPQDGGEVYLLSGVLQLADGTLFVGAAAAGKGGQYRYYEDRKGGRRAEIRIPKDEIEDAICERVKAYLKESGLLERALESSSNGLDAKVGKIDQEVKSKMAQLTQLERTLDGFGDYLRKAALGGELDRVSEIVISERAKVEQEIQKIKGQIQGLERQTATLREQYQEKALREKMRMALIDLSERCDLQKQQLIRAIVPKIIVHPDNRLDIKINPLFRRPDGGVPPKGGFKPSGTKFVCGKFGEPRWIRTIDPFIKSEMLYRLSYGLTSSWITAERKFWVPESNARCKFVAVRSTCFFAER